MAQFSLALEERELFERALGESRERRSAFLDRACAGREELRERVEKLLRLAEGSDGFLDRGVIKSRAADAAQESTYAAGRAIGPYRLVHWIGRGGMAEVWLAERSEGGFKQQAAIKFLRGAHGSLGRQFSTEREVLASLEHPGIARLYDGGATPDGAAYMVMEYVEGEHLIEYANARRLPLGERLPLFIQICEAVAYAHTRLVIHRDLKPANILVNAEGRVKLLDFGIAKVLDAEPMERVTRTVHLSPAYAAPEQLAGGYIGTATDVYALGVVLFELLTDKLPWSSEASALATAVKRLLDMEAPAPSRAAGADSPVPLRQLAGDLDAIVARALRREPAARYPDARALGEDVRRYLQHRPVQARSGARTYVARRFVRRNWLPLSTLILLFAAMAAATVAIAWQANKAREAARRAEREARTATAVQEFLGEIFHANSSAQSDPVKARQTTARELLDLGAKKIETAMADAPAAKLGVLQLLGDLYKDLAMREERIRVLGQAVVLARNDSAAGSPELAAALIDLADAMYGSSANEESEALLREAQAILDRDHDDHSALRARLLAAQAQYYRFVDPPLADDYAGRAVRLYEALPPSRDLADALQLQGGVQWVSGRREAAIVSMQRVIEVLGTLPEERFGLVNAYSDLATLQYELVDAAGAEKNARLALATALAVNGEQHVGTILEKTWLGGTLFALGHTKEGLDLHAQAKRQMLALPGTENQTEIASVLENRGADLAEAGNLDAGMTDLDAALAIRRRGPRNLVLATTLDNAAIVLAELGRYDAARKASVEAADIRATTGGASAVTSTSVTDLRVLLPLRQGHLAQAREALASYTVTNVSGQHLSRSALQRSLYAAEIELRSDDFDATAAATASVRATIRAAALDASFKGVLASADLFDGMAELQRGDAAAALPLLRNALALREGDLLLPISPKIAEAQIALADCQLALGRVMQARELAAKAQAIHAQHKELGEHYREPLRRLLRRLAASAGNAKTA